MQHQVANNSKYVLTVSLAFSLHGKEFSSLFATWGTKNGELKVMLLYITVSSQLCTYNAFYTLREFKYMEGSGVFKLHVCMYVAMHYVHTCKYMHTYVWMCNYGIYICNKMNFEFLQVLGDTVDDDDNGQGPAVIFLWDDFGPTNAPLSFPPAMISYVTSHSNPSIVTTAIPLVIGPVSLKWNT